VNKKEIPGVKERRLQIEKGRNLRLPKVIMHVYK
jgi:hypothetical protein